MNAAFNADRIADDRKRAMEWFCKHLWDKTGIDVRKGITTPQQRVANIVKVIAEHGLANSILGRFNGRDESYSAFCRRALNIEIPKSQELLV